jgi:ADP-ribosylglycohydrolase
MLGAIAGDMIGVPWEALGEKRYDFPLFTEFSRFSDDTVMALAIAHALLEKRDYAETMRDFGRRYPAIGYGGHFERWIYDATMGPYNSYGNGGAMRASPIGYAAGTAEQGARESRAMPRRRRTTTGRNQGSAGSRARGISRALGGAQG